MKRSKPLARTSSLKRAAAPLSRSKPLKRTNTRPASRKAQTAITGRSPRWHDGAPDVCEFPGCRKRRGLERHHVVYQQRIRLEGGDVTDPRNRLTLCHRHHRRHHDRIEPIPLTVLPDSAFEFAFELLGLAAWAYLHRRYAGDDPRLHAHIYAPV